MRRDETNSQSAPLTPGGPLNVLRFFAAFFMVVFHNRVDQPTQARLKARPNDGPGLKARLAALLPHPDPTFDPSTRNDERAPRVREIPMHVGPLPCGFHGREQQDGSAGLAWG